MARYILFVALFISSSIAIVSTVLYALCKNTSPTPLSSANETCPSTSSAASNWTGPDWASFPTTYDAVQPLPGPEPIPRSITDPAVIQLVQNTQEQLLSQYDALGTIACFAQGDTYNCQGPWLNGGDWSNQTLSATVVQNTIASWEFTCSFNQAYESVNRQVFYGFTVNNITDSLQGIAHSASMFAAGACIFNSSCAATYNNDTAQMYYDFRNYVNSTFFDTLTTALSQNNSLTYCPRSISSPASIFSIPTTNFDGGKEYFGLHDAIFLPNVAQSINGTIEEAKKELNALLGNNGLKAEGVFLNMVFFTYGSALGMNKRSDDDEVYPGCKRRTWIIEGECEGVIPPRDFDLAGSVLPMKDRDRVQTIAELSGKSTTDLATRGQCDDIEQSIANSIQKLENAKTTVERSANIISSWLTFGLVAGLTTGAATVGVTILGGLTLGLFMAVASCEAFNTCDGFPPTLLSVVRVVTGGMHDAEGVAVLSKLLSGIVTKGITATDPVPFEELVFEALGNAEAVTLFGLSAEEQYFKYILDAAITFYGGASDCCANDCMSAICQQAATGCLSDTGSFWSGTEGKPNCAAR